MSISRRSFLKKSVLFGSGAGLGALALQSLSSSAFAGKSNLAMPNAKLKEFGLQLYSLRDVMPKDPEGVLKQVAGFGYKQLEGFEAPNGMGMFWGMQNTQFKKVVDDLGMQFISSHCDIRNTNGEFEKKAALAGEVGMRYLICPSVGKQISLDDYKRIADKFNACGAICKKNGMRFAYHNHAYSFEDQGGQFPQEIFLKNTDRDIVDFEMDIYWVVTAGQDPIEWLNKYPQRFQLCHLKDRLKDAAPTDRDASCDLGTGSINFSKICKTASQNLMKYYIVEQEKFDGPSLQAALVDALYMQKLSV